MKAGISGRLDHNLLGNLALNSKDCTLTTAVLTLRGAGILTIFQVGGGVGRLGLVLVHSNYVLVSTLPGQNYVDSPARVQIAIYLPRYLGT
jgi:hypothetical protein